MEAGEEVEGDGDKRGASGVGAVSATAAGWT